MITSGKNLALLILCHNQWDDVANFLDYFVINLPKCYLSRVECLICDDYSSECSNLSMRYASFFQRGFKIYRNLINLGPGPSRNLLLSQHSSDYCCFLDGDDSINVLALQEFFQTSYIADIYQHPVIINSIYYKPRVNNFPLIQFSFGLIFSLPYLFRRNNIVSFMQCDRFLIIFFLLIFAQYSYYDADKIASLPFFSRSNLLLFPQWSRIYSSNFLTSHHIKNSSLRLYEDLLPYLTTLFNFSSICIMTTPLVNVNFSMKSRSRNVKFSAILKIYHSLNEVWSLLFSRRTFVFLLIISISSIFSVLCSISRNYLQKLLGTFIF